MATAVCSCGFKAEGTREEIMAEMMEHGKKVHPGLIEGKSQEELNQMLDKIIEE